MITGSDGSFIHASTPQTGVRYDNIFNGSFKQPLEVLEEYTKYIKPCPGQKLWAFFIRENMENLTTKDIKQNITEKLKNHKFDNKILLLSKNPTKEVDHYKNVIIKGAKNLK